MKRVRLGIIGYGNLGRSMIKLLHMKHRYLCEHDGLDIVLACVLGRTGGVCTRDSDCGNENEYEKLLRASSLDEVPGFDANFNFAKMLDSDLIDVVAEFTPTNKITGEPGLTHIRECLKNNIHVTTGNKGPILVAWDELSSLAQEKKLLLGISCTTGGALPTLINGTDVMAGSCVLSIEGVLNGTTNFILDRMEHDGETYAAALRAAQAAGIAEKNPAQDVEGWDTAIKLLIIARVVMRAKINLNDICVKGITDLTPEDVQCARESNARIKLVGRAWREMREVKDSESDNGEGKIICEVAPTVVTPDNPLYNVCGKNKAVRYVSDTMGELFVSGGASDTMAAAAAALRDVVNAHRSGLL